VLRVPVNKTSIAFEKALDLAAGEAVQEWEGVRPDQPLLTDVKTGERVRFLFMYRCQRIGKDYLNNSLIPALCRKAGIPERDARGDLTSHRARSTIASQLANARDPMSLFELMEWLGHKSPQSTVHYVRSSLANQVKQYEAAGYRDRNLRSIAVLVNRKALQGASERDEGGIYYDLGHGYCRHEFFAQCPHRLACVRCPFYEPKDSERLLILEAEGNLIRLRQDLYLTEEEQTVIDGDVVAYRALRQRNWDIPTPAGPTPHQLATVEGS
jgi:hypothetical protein